MKRLKKHFKKRRFGLSSFRKGKKLWRKISRGGIRF